MHIHNFAYEWKHKKINVTIITSLLLIITNQLSTFSLEHISPYNSDNGAKVANLDPD